MCSVNIQLTSVHTSTSTPGRARRRSTSFRLPFLAATNRAGGCLGCGFRVESSYVKRLKVCFHIPLVLPCALLVITVLLAASTEWDETSIMCMSRIIRYIIHSNDKL